MDFGPLIETSSFIPEPIQAPPQGYATGYPYNQPPVQQRARKRRLPLWAIITIIVLSGGLLLMLISCGVGIFFYSQALRSSHPVVKQATPSDSPDDLYKKATSTQPTIEDSLTTTALYWPQYTSKDGTGKCFLADGAYHVTITNLHHFYYCMSRNTVTDFTMQVQMTILKGYGGLAFMITPHTGRMYEFAINVEGRYAVSLHRNLTADNISILKRSFASTFYKGFNQTNLLTVIARHNAFYIYINKQFLTEIDNSELTSGRVGLMAADNTEDADVVFSNAQLWIGDN